MKNLNNRLVRLEISGGGNNQVVVIFVNVGETEAEARARHITENPLADLSGDSNQVLIVRYV